MNALYFSGANMLLRPLLSGAGCIFMLHHVRPARDEAFQPNRHLEITPDFLRIVLEHLRAQGVALITLDDMARRLRDNDLSQRFACFTFDDGYRDNRDFALPVMRAFGAPFTVYAASEFAEGRGVLWWVMLEKLIARNDTLDVSLGGTPSRLACASPEEKQAAFNIIHGWLRGLDGHLAAQNAVADLCAHHGMDATEACRDLCLSFDELQSFARDPLVTIGAHTMTHCALAKGDAATARMEMAESRRMIEERIGKPVSHFAYPYGDAAAAGTREFSLASDIGFTTAVTTRPGMIFPENSAFMQALPRISLNGNYQDTRMLSVLTSGAATAMWNGFRRVNAA